jgi:hypothetical protein
MKSCKIYSGTSAIGAVVATRDARKDENLRLVSLFMENDLKTLPSPNTFLSEDSSIIFDKIHVYFEKFAIFEY